MATTIPNEVAKKAIFTQEFKSVIEDRNIFSPIATKIIATAKNIYSPFTSVTAAKAHTTPCVVPIGTQAVGVDELVLDRYIGNAITDCEEELSYAQFDVIGMYRADLYASVIKKNNEEAAADFLADATNSSGTVALATTQNVIDFLVLVATDAANQAVSLRQRIDGARIVRAEHHGRPFIVAGNSAYNAIVSKIQTVVSGVSLEGLKTGQFIDTPYGVRVINATGLFSNEKQMIYGVGGVPTLAYREDQIKVDMGEIVSKGTFSGASADLDLEPNDPILEKTWYISAQTKGKNGIFSNVAPLVFKKLMA